MHSLEIYRAVGSSGREDDENDVQKTITTLNWHHLEDTFVFLFVYDNVTKKSVS